VRAVEHLLQHEFKRIAAELAATDLPMASKPRIV